MARPKLTDGQIERFQMVVPTDEIGAIEKWRYNNRITSKSEAVRRLCQIGLAFDSEQRSAKDLIRSALDATTTGMRDLLDEAANADVDLNERLRRIASTLMAAVTAELAAFQDMVTTDGTATAMQRDGEIEDLKLEIAKLKKALKGANR
ncbi:conserved hypothetical protein [Mesorhizobium prunaredense]|uniref:Uncharacterized protein n=1 Tax=Mesorhizobium prunaredense TaxID=1631249 RepID=A0A1R3UYE3_9HYPH|nr:hypothetical protein [Mesorhizobium prunaredense]SIT52658.1 conserved hypothetical protein [Mesorhizobium prunaredense]